MNHDRINAGRIAQLKFSVLDHASGPQQKRSIGHEGRAQGNPDTKIVMCGYTKIQYRTVNDSRFQSFLPQSFQERLIGMQITPFIYYIGILADNLNTEKSYDQLPNFTAADILRLTEIGRNQYIRLVSNLISNVSAIFLQSTMISNHG